MLVGPCVRYQVSAHNLASDRSYNGGAPDAFIYVGTRGRPESAGSDGVMVPYPAGTTGPLKQGVQYNGQYQQINIMAKHL